MTSKWTRRCGFYSVLSGLVFVAACAATLPGEQASKRGTPTLQVRVINEFPHDRGAFCQGLAVEGTTLYEGTGQYGRSTLRKVDLTTGEILAQQALSPDYFGEGITIIGDRIYQLTWKERVCVVYDKTTLKYLGVFNYQAQGWGLADDEKYLYMSDGTSTIRVLDPASFDVVRKIRVRDGRRNVDKLNELEFVDGHLLANIWYQDQIAKIDPQNGQVVAWIDCSQVYPTRARPDREHVLNGIAHDAAADRTFITGKNWPRLYEIRIVDEQ